MERVCLGCGRTQKHTISALEKCSDVYCAGEMVYADSILYPVLVMLNNKGYKTKHCRVGNVFNATTSTILTFENGVTFENLPAGCGATYRTDYKTGGKSVVVMYSHNNYTDIVERQLHILSIASLLLEWADGLQDLRGE
ncbi:MAG: hypothetical protein LBI19_04855 [Oscillospiraceae bacterium]|jgi:hypothetical protein|nr:hypothetical protein [Oscillospiraceae bacterium]